MVRTMRIKLDNSSIYRDKTRLEIYNHAGTTVIGKCYLMVHGFDMPVNVTGYDPKDGSKFCSSVTGVLAYYHPQNGKTYLLVINQAIIRFDHLESNLIFPMQCRKNEIKIA